MTGEEFAPQLDFLAGRLARLKADYDEIRSAPANQSVTDARDRFAAHQSLVAIIDFLDSVPEWRDADLGFALRRTMIALNNVNDGGFETWLVNQAPNRSRTTIEILNGRGRCAGVMELLMREPTYQRKQAAEFVVKHLPTGAFEKLASSPAHRQAPWKIVAEWRSRARSHNGAAGDDRQTEREAYLAQLTLAQSTSQPPEALARTTLLAIGSGLS